MGDVIASVAGSGCVHTRASGERLREMPRFARQPARRTGRSIMRSMRCSPVRPGVMERFFWRGVRGATMSTLVVYVRLYSLSYQRPKAPEPHIAHTRAGQATDRGTDRSQRTQRTRARPTATRDRERDSDQRIGNWGGKRKETRMNGHADLPAIMTPIVCKLGLRTAFYDSARHNSDRLVKTWKTRDPTRDA